MKQPEKRPELQPISLETLETVVGGAMYWYSHPGPRRRRGGRPG